MRYLPFVLGCAGVVAAMSTPVHAQNYPWCLIYGGEGGGAKNCGFTTFQQCMATSAGGSDFCMKNDWYKPPAPARRR
jgi:hypothetical protein